jgi:hypothetical protein
MDHSRRGGVSGGGVDMLQKTTEGGTRRWKTCEWRLTEKISTLQSHEEPSEAYRFTISREEVVQVRDKAGVVARGSMRMLIGNMRGEDDLVMA